MAGGSDTRQRTHQILVRLTDEEFASVATRADGAGMARAAYVRATVLGTPGPRAQRRAPVLKQELLRFLGELGRVGNNLNQIARARNAGDLSAHTGLHAEALAAILEMREATLAALGVTSSDDHQGQKP